MHTLEPMVTLFAVLAASFGIGLLLQWLTLHALFHVLPGRRQPSVAQIATTRTRRLVMPLGQRRQKSAEYSTATSR